MPSSRPILLWHQPPIVNLMALPNAKTRSHPRSDAKLASLSYFGTKHHLFGALS
jgi:hypothetical protein